MPAVEREINQYLKHKNIQSIFVSILESICTDLPDDVPSHIVHFLENRFSVKCSSINSKSFSFGQNVEGM